MRRSYSTTFAALIAAVFALVWVSTPVSAALQPWMDLSAAGDDGPPPPPNGGEGEDEEEVLIRAREQGPGPRTDVEVVEDHGDLAPSVATGWLSHLLERLGLRLL